jgi:tetratricopeptide (TPR) repeat protein
VALRLSSTLAVGEHVYALGAPEGLELSLSEGLVSSLRSFDGLSFIQTTAPISHGSSGGGLFDGQGSLIGITTFTFKDGQNLNFAIPSDLVATLKQHPAEEVLQSPEEKNSSEAMMLSDLAADQMESDDFPAALKTMKRLVELRPDDPFQWAGLGELYLKAKRLDRATEACQKAVQLSPGRAEGWSCLGDIYESQGLLPQAEEALKKAVDLDPSQEAQLVNLFMLGRVFAEEGKKGGTMTTYEKLKTLDQNHADRFFKMFVERLLDQPER